MSTPNVYLEHVYGAEFITARGAHRTQRVRANSISEARRAAKANEQPGEEMLAVWLIG